MNFLGELKRRARHIVGPVLGLTLFGYFAYHVVQGDRGLFAWLRLSQQVDAAEAQYRAVRAERIEFAHRVRLLQPSSLDPDLLEERARAVLGVVHPDDIVILKPQARPAAGVPHAPRKAATLPPTPPGFDRRGLDDLITTTLSR
ncbi:MAG: septum formation initiator family protein [Alphaproteobacteria bacterium]|nr:septum formation initiator family protein [Alphaproteobacteria bacterium]